MQLLNHQVNLSYNVFLGVFYRWFLIGNLEIAFYGNDKTMVE